MIKISKFCLPFNPQELSNTAWNYGSIAKRNAAAAYRKARSIIWDVNPADLFGGSFGVSLHTADHVSPNPGDLFGGLFGSWLL